MYNLYNIENKIKAVIHIIILVNFHQCTEKQGRNLARSCPICSIFRKKKRHGWTNIQTKPLIEMRGRI